MDNIIIDEMKKESKLARQLMIFAFVLLLIEFIYMYVNNKSLQDEDVLTMFILYLYFGILGFYVWLCAIKYSLKITKEKILLKTLFRKVEINICSIEKYTCKRYRKSVFYQFKLFTKDKNLMVSTRYKDEFIKILEENNIEQISK